MMVQGRHISTVWQCIEEKCGKKRQRPAKEREQRCRCGQPMFAARFIYEDERPSWVYPKTEKADE